MNKKQSGDFGEDDLEFSIDSPGRKPLPRRSRRPDSLLSSNFHRNNSQDNHINVNTSPIGFSEPSVSKKSGGWADDAPAPKMSWLRRVSRSSPSKDMKPDTRFNSKDNDNEIPSIPDLDDVYDDEMASQIAEAPSVAINKVMTYQELDYDLNKVSAFQLLDGIALKALTKALRPEHKVKEEDVTWTWDMLFTETVSQLTELEMKKDANKEKDEFLSMQM